MGGQGVISSYSSPVGWNPSYPSSENIPFSLSNAVTDVLSFIYADLIIIPLLLVYRKYFGRKLALWIFAIFYVSMAITGIIVDLLFNALGWIPTPRALMSVDHEQLFSFNYTFWLNVAFIAIGGILTWLAKSENADRGTSRCCHFDAQKRRR